MGLLKWLLAIGIFIIFDFGVIGVAWWAFKTVQKRWANRRAPAPTEMVGSPSPGPDLPGV